MPKNIESKQYELFSDLSDKQQENVAGGSAVYDLFIQKTEVFTYGSSQLDASETADGSTLSSDQNTGYVMSQITIGLNLGFLFGDGPRRRSKNLNLLYRMLVSLL